MLLSMQYGEREQMTTILGLLGGVVGLLFVLSFLSSDVAKSFEMVIGG